MSKRIDQMSKEEFAEWWREYLKRNGGQEDRGERFLAVLPPAPAWSPYDRHWRDPGDRRAWDEIQDLEGGDDHYEPDWSGER